MEPDTNSRIHDLWDDLAHFSAAESDAALDRLMAVLAELIHAPQAYWLGTVRVDSASADDPIAGWRPRILHYLHVEPAAHQILKENQRRIEDGNVDPGIIANLRQAGRFRVTIKHEIVPPEWFESEYYRQLIGSRGIRDIIHVTTPLGPDAESWLGFNRLGEAAPLFSEREREILDYAVRPLKWFHHQLMLHHGLLLADKPLTEAERRVLSGLLTDRTEGEIAQGLGLTAATVHTYCIRICRKFGVRGRTGLAALWLGRGMEQLE